MKIVKVVALIVGVLCTLSGLIWMGQDERITSRLKSMECVSNALQGRVEHWQEAKEIVRDFPWTGSGWGTYAVISPLYLSHNSDFSFQNAENEYLEVTVEAGFVGLALFVMALLLVAYASARAIRADNEGRQLPSGLCGLLAVTAISVISLTDFSLAIGSILLTFCVIAGSVYAPYSRIQVVPRGILFACRRRTWRLIFSGFILLASGLAFSQVHRGFEVEMVVDQIPVEGAPPTLEVARCDVILRQLNQLSTIINSIDAGTIRCRRSGGWVGKIDFPPARSF